MRRSRSPGAGPRSGTAATGSVPALATAGAVVALNAGLLLAVHHLALLSGSRSGWGVGLDLSFYGVVMALGLLASRRRRPGWGQGPVLTSLAAGLAAGLAVVGLVVGTQALLGQRVGANPVAALLASRSSVPDLLTGALLVVVVAPVVEEYVFRGVLIEALRRRGRGVAVGISSLLFAIGHLHPGLVLYYASVGRVLGLSYWKRGLAASVTAHATFNGVLLAVGLAAGAHAAGVHLPGTHAAGAHLASAHLARPRMAGVRMAGVRMAATRPGGTIGR